MSDVSKEEKVEKTTHSEADYEKLEKAYTELAEAFNKLMEEYNQMHLALLFRK